MTDLTATEPPASAGDVLLLRVIYLVAAIGLVSLAIIGALAIIAALAAHEVKYPDVLDNIVTGALVGLTGLLAARRTS